MDIIYVVLGIAIIGFFTWLLTEKVPMDNLVRTLIRVFVAAVVALYLIRYFSVRVPNLLN